MSSIWNWPDRIQKRLNRVITRRVGLFVKIVLPVVVLFLLFSGVLGFWISGLTRSALLDQSRSQTATQFATTRHLMEAEWADFTVRIKNPVLQQRLAPLVSKGMVDLTANVLRELATTVGADVLHAYDRQGKFLVSSADITGYQEPAFLAALARELIGKAEGGWFLIELPGEVLGFEKLNVEPRREGAGAAAVVAHAVMTDEFGDTIGMILGIRILNGNQDLVKRIAELVGGEVTLFQGDLRIATSLIDAKGGSLLATRLDKNAVRKLEKAEQSSGLVDIAGASYDSHYGWLTDRQGSRVALLGVTNPVDAVLQSAASVRNRILLAGLLAVIGFSLILGMVIKALLGGMEQIRSYMGSVAGGYLGGQLKIDTRDELEDLGDAITGTVARLKELVSGVEGSFNLVEKVAGNLVNMADTVASGAGEQEKVVSRLDGATTSLAGLMDKMASEMSAMKLSAQKNLTSLQSLSGMVGKTSDSANTFAGSATETTSAIHEMSASLSQVATSVATLTQFITETSMAMKEIDLAAGQIKELTSRTREEVRGFSHEASENGRSAMGRANQGMESIKALMISLRDTVRGVGQRSEEIGEVVGLISEIADQTNLLALNASILAAQSGEQGKAFGVVAQEIRSLSERTDNSIKQIEDNVRGIQSESRKAVKEVEHGFKVVDGGVGEVVLVEKVLEKIIEGASSSRNLTEKIAERSNAQSVESTKVTESLLQISAMAEQLSSATGQQNETAQYILKISEETGRNMEGLKRSASGQFETVKSLRGEAEGTSSMADRLATGAGDARKGLTVVRESLTVIRRSVEENRARVGDLRALVDMLSSQAQAVRTQISSFKLDA